ncbi:MAG: autotransporter outer membrane beta-barrel domain-containing protein, partial [Rickettsiales bacterium]|nr:autotransporter outer membrane beta-barrel domain-containing protein [Rickettsiales bacterium]
QNINLTSLHRDLKIEGKLSDDKKIYRIVVKKTVKIRSNPGETNLFSHLGTIDHNQRDVANLLSNTYFGNYGDDGINNMLDRIDNFKNQEDQKTVLSQISPSLLTDIITMNLLSSQRNVVNRPVPSSTVVLEPIYSNSKLTSRLADNAAAIRLNYGHSFRNLIFSRDLSLAFFGDLTNHSLRDSQSSKVSALGETLAFRLETEVINGINIAISLSDRRTSHKIDRSIEKLNEIAKSNFSTNTFNAAMALEKEFRVRGYLIFTPSASLETSLLSYGKFSEEGARVLNLTIDGGSHHLVAGNFGLTMAVDLANFKPFISLGTSYLLSYSSPEISASLREYASSGKLKSRATDVGKLSGFVALGLNYQLNKNVSVSLGSSYRGASGYRSLSGSVTFKFSF